MVNLGQAWAEEFMKLHPKAMVAVTGGGSGAGIAALINGSCDIAETSRKMTVKEIAQAKTNGRGPVEHIVGMDGIAVVAHPVNPVSRLTINELAGIFTGRITNWKEVGGLDKKIVILSREVNSGTHVYFKEHVLRGGDEKNRGEFAPAALLMPSSQAIADEVAQNPGAIGYYGMGYISKKQKVVAVARQKGGVYVAPDIASVRSGKYPISRPLLIYTSGKPKGLTKEFIDFIMSMPGQEIVKKLDFVPVK
jgi:phosphate transport system substrate-binding protein